MIKIDADIGLTDAIKNYLEKKVQRAVKNTEGWVSSVKVNLWHEPRTDSHVVEIIVFLNGGKTIRNYSRTDDMYASIDIACASVERQLRKAKEKVIDIKRYNSIKDKLTVSQPSQTIATESVAV